MANETTAALLTTNGGRASEVLADYLHEQLYDATDLRMCMRMIPRTEGGIINSVTKDAVPSAAAAASSETSGGFSNTAYTTSEFQLTPARYGLLYKPSDLFQVTRGPGAGQIGMEQLAKKLVQAVGLTLTDLLTAASANLATSVGTTGVNLSIDDLYSAMYALILANVPNTPDQPIHLILHPQQIVDMMESLRGESGPSLYMQASTELLKLRGPGFKGLWNDVYVWQSDSVPTANAAADRAGMMIGYGSHSYQLGNVRSLAGTLVNPADILVMTDELMVERVRDGANGLSSMILNFYPTVVESEDLRGVKIVTDA